MIEADVQGSFSTTMNWLKKASSSNIQSILDNAGARGVAALASATPTHSGKTAQSWSYKVEKIGSGYQIIWSNSHVNKGVNIAIILQYGHGTGTGGYVQGRDYINPAIRSVFQEISNDVRKAIANG